MIKKMLITIGVVILALVLAVYIFMQQPQFGKMPTGARLERILNSPHYRDGRFQNESPTPDLAEGVGYGTVMWDFFFKKDKRVQPRDIIPSKKTDLINLPADSNVLVWFGHSSYFLQIDGKRFLSDPVFSGSASPISFTTPGFKGTDVYTVDEFPYIDYLLISHDHWDHLDYKTVTQLKTKVGKVITGLGVGEHLEYWGFDPAIIIEKDWNEEVQLDSGFKITTAPTRHFSGRGFKRCPTLWSSFVLETPSKKIYIGGDSGYDTHFKRIGEKYGPFDLVILECGQYNAYWKYIHMMPEEVAQAAIDLKAKRLFPVHWSKFALSLHAWDESISRVTKEAERLNMPLIHPMIGEKVDLNDSTYRGVRWWEGLQ